MEWLKEFYLENKDWIDHAIAAFVSAFVGYLTALFTTRRSKLVELIDGKKVYDDNDLVLLPDSNKWVELGSLSICRKGKNADEKESQPK